MSDFKYFTPGSLEEALALNDKIAGSRYIAGGTDIMVKIKNQKMKPGALISLRSIPGLSGIRIEDKVHIGALTTITELISHKELGRLYPVLIQAAARIGSAQIRNAGTVGGNLCNCSPCADTALALLVLDAQAVLRGSKKNRQVPLQEFFKGPGQSCLIKNEILTELILKKPSPHTKAIFMKKGRVKMDLAIASVAVLLEMENDICKKARLGAGSVAPTPLRLSKVEALLENTPITSELVEKAQEIAMESVSPITDIRSTEVYRRQVVGIYLKRLIQELMGW